MVQSRNQGLERMAGKRRKAARRNRPSPGFPPPEALIKALSHPIRARALSILTERVAGPKNIAAELDIKLSNVSYHVRTLEELGLIEIVEEESVRGAIAHFYKAVEPPLQTQSAWSSLDPKVRNIFSASVVETLFADLSKSASAGTLENRNQDVHLLARTSLQLDEAGWEKVRDIQARSLQEILQEQSAAAVRLNGSGGSAIRAVLGQLLFEVPYDEDRDA
jgi:DNA-binding transcriptional ArsR family regulator